MKTGRLLRSSGFIKNNPKLSRLIRNLGIGVSKRINSKGVMKNIGGTANFLMTPDFTFYDVEGWGKGQKQRISKTYKACRGE